MRLWNVKGKRTFSKETLKRHFIDSRRRLAYQPDDFGLDSQAVDIEKKTATSSNWQSNSPEAIAMNFSVS
jgi:hypothetical protein